jgi:hypothetical protein
MIAMGDTVTTPESKPSEAPKPAPAAPMASALMPLLFWIVAGILVGYAAYALLMAHPQVQPQPQPNINVTPIPVPPTNVMPAIQVVLINDTNCADCNVTSLLLSALMTATSQLKLNLTGISTLDASSPEGMALISKYSITKVPTLIVEGGANASANLTSWWATIGGTSEQDGALVYRDVYPPYYDLSAKKMVGVVDVVEIKAPSCGDCFNISGMTEMLSGAQVGMRLGNVTSIDYNSTEGKALIAKYGLTKVPALLLSPDAAAYKSLASAWQNVGTIEPDGWYVYRSVYAPYINITSGAVAGRVSIIELTDLSCASCYNVSEHYSGLEQSGGMVFTNRTTYDANSTQGQALIKKYNITAVPTIVMSSDAMVYSGFDSYWVQIGTVESDGWLVLRDLSRFGTYRNLTSGNITVATGG